MEIAINDILKELRKSKGNTQEELATKLGISVQAVSKWERGEGYPDITLLPAVALYYDVSVDELLGVGEMKKRARQDEYLLKSAQLTSVGSIEENISLLREARKEFPNHVRINWSLMGMLSLNLKENASEIIEIGEQLLAASAYKETSTSDIHETMLHMLCKAYKEIGLKEKSLDYAARAVTYHGTRNELMSVLLEGDEAIACCQDNLRNLVNLISFNVARIAVTGEHTNSDLITLYTFALDTLNLLYADGDYGFAAAMASGHSMTLAQLYAKEGDSGRALDYLEQFAEAAIYFEATPDYKHTSPLVNRLDREWRREDYPVQMHYCQLILPELEQDANFESIRHDARYAAVINRLKECAK